MPVAWISVLALAMVAPTLRPGFTLSYDMVFTPRQDLLPATLGIGGSLPRAVPQDAVVALAEAVIPGEWLQKAILLAVPLLAGLGMLRLLRHCCLSSRLIAATIVVWNPYVAERLVIGHWGLVLAYALTPWALATALDMRRGRACAGIALILIVAAASLTPSGSVLAVALTLPLVLAPRSQASLRARALTAAGLLLCWLPWLVPALANPALGQVDAQGATVFAVRDEGPGVLPTILGLGGIWNADVTLPSRSWPTAPVLAVVLIVLCIAGLPAMTRTLGRAVVGWWAAVALAGLVAAAASALLPGAWAALLQSIPGAGILRDAHKWLGPLALLVGASAGVFIGGLLAHIGDTAVRRALLVLVALVPVAALPDLAWGAAGRLQAVDYPGAWGEVREVIAADPRPGDVVVLPWSAFRRFAWNADRTVLDPAPRWLTRTTVVADGLSVSTRSGMVTIAGEDPRAREIGRALADGQPLSRVMGELGIGWALVELGQPPGLAPGALSGLVQVRAGPDLALFALEGPVRQPEAPAYARWVIAVDVIVGLVLSALAGAAGIGGFRTARARRREDERTPGEPLVR